jgi:hypothetical protein
MAIINCSAAAITRSLAAILSSTAPSTSATRRRCGAATVDTETSRRIRWFSRGWPDPAR